MPSCVLHLQDAMSCRQTKYAGMASRCMPLQDVTSKPPAADFELILWPACVQRSPLHMAAAEGANNEASCGLLSPMQSVVRVDMQALTGQCVADGDIRVCAPSLMAS